jgi:hypothetical protein
MSRYAGRDEIQRAVNLHATGMSSVAVARAMNKARGTVQGWLRAGGIAERSGITPKVETVVEEVPPAVIKVRVKAGSSNRPEGAVTKVLAIGDAHDDPETPKDRFRWMGKLACDRGVDWVVQIGDFASIDSLNAHIPNETLAGKLKNPYSQDVQSLNEALGNLNEGLNGHKPKKHVCLGNHERRVWLYEEQRPEVSGILTGELVQTFTDNGWTQTPYGEYFFLGGVGWIHAAINRMCKTYGGKNAEATISNDAVFDHCIGHSHVRREHRAPKLGPSKHVTVLNLGCALPQGRVESYVLHGALSGWWWGVHVVTLQNGQIAGVDAIPMSDLERMYA